MMQSLSAFTGKCSDLNNMAKISCWEYLNTARPQTWLEFCVRAESLHYFLFGLLSHCSFHKSYVKWNMNELLLAKMLN